MAKTIKSPKRRGRICSFQLDWDAHAMLLEMTSTKSRGAFVAGLVRAEYARQQERWQRREKGLPGIEPLAGSNEERIAH